MEFYIAEEGKPVNIGYESTTIAYYGSEIELCYETEQPHGDGIFSAKLPILEMKLPFGCMVGILCFWMRIIYWQKQLRKGHQVR